jgi:hypothetical protein
MTVFELNITAGNNNGGRSGHGLYELDVAVICWTNWELSLELNLELSLELKLGFSLGLSLELSL